MVKNFIAIATLIICLPACGPKQNSIINKFLLNETLSKNENPIGFAPTQYELIEIEKWKNKSTGDLVSGVLVADRAAFHDLAMDQLNGLEGFAKDEKAANSYLYKAASLGFAPSLEKIALMYLEHYRNPFLAQVYVHLIISLGHAECTQYYDKLKSQMKEECGELLSGEIEKISSRKMEIILKNQTELAMANNDKTKFVFIMKNMVEEDLKEFNEDFWMKIIREGRKRK